MSGIRIVFYLFLFIIASGCATAQPTGTLVLSKKEQKKLSTARMAFDAGDYNTALSTLDGLIDGGSVPDAYYLRGLVRGELGNYDAAIADLLAGQQGDANPSPTLFAELGRLYARAGNFPASLAAYEQYRGALGTNARQQTIARADALVEQARTAARLAAEPVPYTAAPLAGGINTTEHLEYFPSLSTDGSFMIFTRRVNRENEDFYRSDRNADGSWSEAFPLTGVNTEFDEGAQTVTADGAYLVFTICNRPENRGSCDLYFSQQVEGGGWTPAQSLGSTINTTANEAQPSISADGRLLFFSSDRAGGAGGRDLYVTGRLPDGTWSEPSNLGPGINTAGSEQYPFWAADGRTLFFTSNKHPGLGGEDLFRTELTPQNTWAAPVNLGYPINTAADETNLFIGLDGTTAFFSKRYIMAGTGKTDVDIYSFDLPADLRPTPATYLAATVTDAKTGAPLAATVRLSPLDGTAPPAQLTTGEDGTFLSVLPTGRDYALTVDQPGYLFYSDRFELTGELVPGEPYQLTIELQPVEEAIASGDAGETDGSVAFRNVLFETGSATLLPVSGQELNRLAEVMIAKPALRVKIAGHTDDVGEETDNQQLSEDRAASVRVYLINQGIDGGRITTVGYGESRPVADNGTEEGRAKNRRTTFRLK